MIKSSIIFVCFLFVWCSSTSPQYLSTQIITSAGVYIFGPSLTEADTLATDQGEALNDFSYYSNRIAAFVRAKGLPCEYISARTIKIRFAGKRFVTVYRDSVEFGTILADGRNKPLVLKYVTTDAELKEKCNEYFNFK